MDTTFGASPSPAAVRSTADVRKTRDDVAKTPCDTVTPQLDCTLENADYLLSYAAEAGIAVPAEVAQRIIAARRGGDAVWDSSTAGDVMAAITTVASSVHPVTAETLRACRNKAHAEIKKYTLIALGLALLIIPLSMFSFVSTGISTSITADVRTANDLAVSLHTQLETPLSGERVAAASSAAPPSSLPDLQQFASAMRSIRDHASKLSLLTPPFNRASDASIRTPDASFELDPALENRSDALRNETNRLTALYQKVRLHAKEVQDDVSLFYGSIGACVLPMLYALLGACAFLLRLFSDELNTRTFSPSYAISARFFIALIGGMIVGLFNNFTLTQGVSLSPLAVAFLVGYAADVFFSFLEGLLQNFKRSKTA